MLFFKMPKIFWGKVTKISARISFWPNQSKLMIAYTRSQLLNIEGKKQRLDVIVESYQLYMESFATENSTSRHLFSESFHS